MRTLWTQGAKVWNKWCYLQVVLVRTFVTSPYLNSFLLYPDCIRIFKYLHTQIILSPFRLNTSIFECLDIHIAEFFTIYISQYLILFGCLRILKYLNIWCGNACILAIYQLKYLSIWFLTNIKIHKYLKIFEYSLAGFEEKFYLCNRNHGWN